MVLLVFGEAQESRITGVLVDASEGGFRVRHPYPGFQQNDVVLFLHPLSEGARALFGPAPWRWTSKPGLRT